MYFCEKCDNMYYIKIGDESESNQLIYYCRNCGHENKELNNSNICVSKTIVNGSGTAENMSHFINEYTKFDPTLPRITTIKCPNQSCKSNSNVDDDKIEREVLYIRYDDDNMKYVYLCCHCDTKWKTDN
jgi:DNA-directed RNA polymerase subunit M/transcription elongation factor TFIIS